NTFKFMTRNAAPVITNYTLNKGDLQQQQAAVGTALKRLAPLLAEEKPIVALPFVAMLVSSGSALLGPLIIGHTVDVYIQGRNFNGVLEFAAILFVVYLCGLLSNYFQVRAMGTVGRRLLFKLRNALFTKLQELPLVFFNQNKTGDL